MSDLLQSASSSIFDIQNLLNGSTQAIVRPNLSMNPTVPDPERPGFVFDIPTGEAEEFESDTTDHYTENGSFLNDHIVNKPIKITLTGLIGELVYKSPKGGFLGGLRSLAGQLAAFTGIGGNFTPGLIQAASVIQQKAQDVAKIANQGLSVLQGASNAISSFYGPKKTLQKTAYDTLSGLWINKTIFTITTPWKDHPAMVISAMSFKQDEVTNDYTNISITFKEFRFASTKLTILQGADIANDITGAQNIAAVPAGQAGVSNTTLIYDATQAVKTGGAKNVISAIIPGFGGN